MTEQTLFPLADTPDVDLRQAGGTNVAVDETFATAQRIQLDSTSQDAFTALCRPPRDEQHARHWSRWRHQHQERARRSHFKRQRLQDH
jgi:hypothetical protein